MRTLKFGIALVLAAAIAAVAHVFWDAHRTPYTNVAAPPGAPRFVATSLPFTHQFVKSKHLPFLASAAIDIDGDGRPELFLGGGAGQQDGLFRFQNDTFVSVIEGSGITKDLDDASYGAAALDMNRDGLTDLVVTRESGLYLYINRGNGKFDQRKLPNFLDAKSRGIGVALGDINGDGHADIFLVAYLTRSAVEGQNIFNKPGYGAKSVLLLNNGDNTFRDITSEAGIAEVHNTLGAVFVDLDGDGRQDLVIAQDTGQVRIWRNAGSLPLIAVPNPSSDRFGYPMGIGVGDLFGSGTPDLYFSNVGGTLPAFLARGDLRPDQLYDDRYWLFRNDGDFRFTSAGAPTKTEGYGFGWGTVIADIDLDGRPDILIAQSYVSIPWHRFFPLPSRVLLQQADRTFASAEAAFGLENRGFGISPIVADFNSDGYPDIVWANLSGPSRAFLSRGGANAYLGVVLPDQAESFAAQIVLSANGQRQTRQFLSGQGLCADQSHTVVFGLGETQTADSLTVKFASGRTITINNPKLRTNHVVPYP